MDALIERYCKKLKLSGLYKGYKDIEFKNKEQFIHDLLRIEIEEREINKVNRAIKSAGFKVPKTLADFTFTSNIDIPDTTNIERTKNLEFLERKENLIFLGSVGTGKTHLATAIALSLCEQGRHVRFYTATGLANILLEKQQRGTLSSFTASLKMVELMVLDEIGFITLHKEASELLFQVVSDCYEQKSLIITSNLEFSQWNTVFGDTKLTAALIDRLIHHSHIVVFSGPGYRMEEAMRRQKKGGVGL